MGLSPSLSQSLRAIFDTSRKAHELASKEEFLDALCSAGKGINDVRIKLTHLLAPRVRRD